MLQIKYYKILFLGPAALQSAGCDKPHLFWRYFNTQQSLYNANIEN